MWNFIIVRDFFWNIIISILLLGNKVIKVNKINYATIKNSVNQKRIP